MFKDGFNLVCLDGSVFSVARGVNERLLKGLITRDGGEPVYLGWLHQTPLVQDQAALTQLKVAKQAFQVIEERHRLGNPVSDEDYHKWSLRLLEAERATSTTKAEEIAARKAHFKRMKELSERTAKLYQNGERDMLQRLDTSYWEEQAAGWLRKASQEIVNPTP